MNKEKQILNYMQKLGLSREEAEQLYKDEEEDNLPELTTEQKKVEKEMRQADRKKETISRKRERKPDNDKRFLIDTFIWALTTDEETNGDNVNAENAIITRPEREIEFDYNGNHYRLVLMKPRKEK
jgi:DNA-binding transcriptional MerR regulator